MPDDSTVINFRTGKSLSEERKDLDESMAIHTKMVEESLEPHKKRILESLDKMRKMVQEDKIDGLCFVARNPETGYFIPGMLLNEATTTTSIFMQFSTALRLISNDAMVESTTGPVMTLDGDIIVLPKFEEMQDEF